MTKLFIATVIVLASITPASAYGRCSSAIGNRALFDYCMDDWRRDMHEQQMRDMDRQLEQQRSESRYY